MFSWLLRNNLLVEKNVKLFHVIVEIIKILIYGCEL
jgi:hypothetical protein